MNNKKKRKRFFVFMRKTVYGADFYSIRSKDANGKGLVHKWISIFRILSSMQDDGKYHSQLQFYMYTWQRDALHFEFYQRTAE